MIPDFLFVYSCCFCYCFCFCLFFFFVLDQWLGWMGLSGCNDDY